MSRKTDAQWGAKEAAMVVRASREMIAATPSATGDLASELSAVVGEQVTAKQVAGSSVRALVSKHGAPAVARAVVAVAAAKKHGFAPLVLDTLVSLADHAAARIAETRRYTEDGDPDTVRGEEREVYTASADVVADSLTRVRDGERLFHSKERALAVLQFVSTTSVTDFEVADRLGF